MVLNDDTLHIIKNTPKLSGFLGTQGKPTPISNSEATRITEQMIQGEEKGIILTMFTSLLIMVRRLQNALLK